MHRLLALGPVVALLAACGGTGPSTTPTAVVAANGTPPATATAAATPNATIAEPSPSPIPNCLPDCIPLDISRPGPLPAGIYETRKFFGSQLRVTLPDETWRSEEDSTGEFALSKRDDQDLKVQFWIDVYPTKRGTLERLAGYDGTAKALVAWLKANPDLEVKNLPPAQLGSLQATSIEISASKAIKNEDPDCPKEFQPCVWLFGFPQWDGVYELGTPFRTHLIAVDTTWGGTPHALYAMIDTLDPPRYADFDAAATAIIAGVQLPVGVGS
jgi:hypothetical protein